MREIRMFQLVLSKIVTNYNGRQNRRRKLNSISCPLLAIKASIISVAASNPTLKEIYGLDRQMNFHRSRDSGESWRQITDGYLNVVQKETKLIQATALPENLVSGLPTANLTTVANSTGTTWGGECTKVLLCNKMNGF